MKKVRFLTLLVLTAGMMLAGGQAHAQYLDTLFEAEGYVGWDMQAYGMAKWIYNSETQAYERNGFANSGSVNLNMDGTVLSGFTTWHGRDDETTQYQYGVKNETGDPTVTFNGTSITGTILKEAPMYDKTVGYYKDVTQYLLPGVANYTMSNVNFGRVNDGFGVVGFYDNAPSAGGSGTADYVKVAYYANNDFFYVRDGDNQDPITNPTHNPLISVNDNDELTNGPNSEVYSFDVPENATGKVTLDFLFAGFEADQGGVGNHGIYDQLRKITDPNGGDRKASFWFMIGEGSEVPLNLVDNPEASLFITSDGTSNIAHGLDGQWASLYEWRGEMDEVMIDLLFTPEYLSEFENPTLYFQIESNSDLFYRAAGGDRPLGESGSLVGTVVAFGVTPPDNPVPEPASLLLFGLGSLGMFRFLKRKK